jgi:TonB family protein
VALKLAVAITWMRARDWKAASGVAGLVLVVAVGGFVLRGIFGSSTSTGKAGVKTSQARTANTDTLGVTTQDAKVSERTDPVDPPERVESTSRGVDRRSARETAAAARAASRAASGSDVTAIPAVESKQPAPNPVPEAPKADVKLPTPTADVKADAERSTQPQAVDLPVTTGLRDLNAGQTSLPPAPAIAPPPAPAPGESPARVANKIYRADDPGVVPPAAISQSLPAYPGVVVVSKRAALEVVINENGKVESATMRDHISPAYDKQVLAAVATWRYRPATVNGTPVKFSKVIGITVDKN